MAARLDVFRRVSKSAVGRGLVFCVGAVVLGRAAHFADLAAVEARWRREHGPTAFIWRASLEARGVRAAKDAEEAHRALRTLPGLVDAPDAAWVSGDAEWFAAYVADAPDGLPLIFLAPRAAPRVGAAGRPPPAPKPESWRPIGAGWEALEAALVLAAERREPPVAAPGKPRRRAYRDPREIVY